MKNSRRFYIWLVGILSGLFLFGSTLFLMPTVEAAENSQTITLHKKQFETPLTSVSNTGDRMNEFDKIAGLNGVTFTVYDATDLYTVLRTTGTESEQKPLSLEDAYQYLTNLSATELAKLTIATQSDGSQAVGTTQTITNEVGVVTFTLPTVSGANQNAVYLIVETAGPAQIQAKAAPLVVSLPVYEADNTTLKTTVHLYPKTLVTGGTLSFVKYGVAADGQLEPLKGATFKLHQTDAQGVSQGVLLKELDENNLPVFGAESSETPALLITSTQKVEVPAEYRLPDGTYYFEEIQSVAPYHLHSKSNKIVTAEISQQGTVVTYGYYDEKMNHLTNQSQAAAYNYAVPKPTKTVDQTSADRNAHLNYTGTLLVPQDMAFSTYTTFSLVDTPNEALELVTKVTEITAQLVGVANGNLTTVAKKVGTNGFRFDFHESATDMALLKANPGKMIQVSFQMKIKQESGSLDEALENTLTFDNNFRVETDRVAVETHGKRFVKQDLHTEKPLADASFIVRKKQQGQWVYLAKEASGYFWGTEQQARESHVITSEVDGTFEVVGLATGDYELVEIQAPKNYVLPSNPTVPFEVTKTSYTESAAAQIVGNTQGGFLPITGGQGIYLYLVSGGLLMLAAVITYKRRKRG